MAAINICSYFGAPKIKSATVSTVSPSICHEVVGPDAILLNLILFSQDNEKYYMGLSERLFRLPVEGITRISFFFMIEFPILFARSDGTACLVLSFLNVEL